VKTEGISWIEGYFEFLRNRLNRDYMDPKNDRLHRLAPFHPLATEKAEEASDANLPVMAVIFTKLKAALERIEEQNMLYRKKLDQLNGPIEQLKSDPKDPTDASIVELLHNLAARLDSQSYIYEENNAILNRII
jgi:hypothetical protein